MSMKILTNISNENRTFFPLNNSTDRSESKKPLSSLGSNYYRDLLTYQEAKMQSPNIGMYLPTNELILIDFDSEDPVEVLAVRDKVTRLVRDNNLKCLVQHTGKGTHLIFKRPRVLNKPGVNKPWLLALGLVADVKINPYVVLELNQLNFPNDGLRLQSDYDYDFNELDELPTILYPVKAVESAKVQLFTFNEGSQNDNIIQHLGFLYNSPYLEINKEIAIDITKNYINQYLMTPRWTNEDEFIIKANAVWSRFTPINIEDRSLEYIVEKVIGDTDWYNYMGDLFQKQEDGSFTPEKDDHHRLLLNKYGITKEQKRKELLNNIRLQAKEPEIDKLTIKTPTQTLHLDLESRTFYPGPETFSVHSLKYDYDPNTPVDEHMDTFLNDISNNNINIRTEILQALSKGLIMESSRKMYVFHGKGRNGKSMLLDTVFSEVFLNPFTSMGHESLEIISGNDFGASNLKNKLVNVSDELESGVLPGSAILKSIIAGQTINTSGKGVDRKAQVNHVTLYLSSNHTLRSRDKGSAWTDRLKFIPMLHQFPQIQGFEASLIKKRLTSESAIKYLIKLLIEELNQSFNGNEIESQESRELFLEFMQEHDYAKAYVERLDINAIEGKTKDELHADYVLEATGEGFHILENRLFNKKVKEVYPNLELKNSTRGGMQTYIWKVVS